AALYTLPLHDALPISGGVVGRLLGEGARRVTRDHGAVRPHRLGVAIGAGEGAGRVVQVLRLVAAPRGGRVAERHGGVRVLACLEDRKSTRLNSSHSPI